MAPTPREHALVGLSTGRMDAMVIDQREFYNREYSESTADDEREMSQEEMTFTQNAKETVRLEKGHYRSKIVTSWFPITRHRRYNVLDV